ncbi:MAG TPA: ParB/RepB/Spo0J family partition protein [Roseiflexaceae bacterium]|nr:ParB/RepB/Spo0J family partition protein [Roseiflexaceae bacterium]
MARTATAKAKSTAAAKGLRTATYTPLSIEVPDDLPGWQWHQFTDRHPIEVKLISPDGQFETKTYVYCERAVAEARRWKSSQSKRHANLEAIDLALIERLNAVGGALLPMPDGSYHLQLGTLFDGPVDVGRLEPTLARYEAYLAETAEAIAPAPAPAPANLSAQLARIAERQDAAQAAAPARPQPVPLDPALLKRLHSHGGQVKRTKAWRNGTHYLVVMRDFHGHVLPERLARMLDRLDELEAPVEAAAPAPEPPRGLDALLRAGLVDQAEALAREGRVWGALLGVAHRWSPDGEGWSATCGQTINGGWLPDGAAGPERCATCDPEADRLPGSQSDDGSLPLIDLFAMLETHRRGLPRHPDLDFVFSRPAGLPEHLSVPIGMIKVGRYQPRFEFKEDELQELAESIRSKGIRTRLKVFINEHGEFELIAGERRLRAAGRVGLTLVPVEVEQRSLRDIAEDSLMDNLLRDNLSALEEGESFERLMQILGISENELAARLGKNRGYIQQRRGIVGAAPELRQALINEQIKFAQARGLIAGSGGRHDIQVAALADLARTPNVDEDGAKHVALRLLYSALRPALTDLGWSTSENNWPVIWSANDRPIRFSTGKKLLDHVSKQERPTAETATYTPLNIPREDQVFLSAYGIHKTTEYLPWTAINHVPERGTIYIRSQEEFAALMDELKQRLSAMQDRYRALGWSLELQNFDFLARGQLGKIQWLSSWNAVERTLKEIEAGTLVDEAPKPAKASKQPQQPIRTCTGCQKTFSDNDVVYRYPDYYCKAACLPKLQAQIDATRRRIHAEVAEVLLPSLRTMPEPALRLLVAQMADRTWGGEHRAREAAEIRALQRDALINQVLTAAVDAACKDHKAPVYDLPSVKDADGGAS